MTVRDWPLELWSIRTPKGNVWHLVDEREPRTLCGRSHGLNTEYIKVGADGGEKFGSPDNVNCGKCRRLGEAL